jgi:hypothetical protein
MRSFGPVTAHEGGRAWALAGRGGFLDGRRGPQADPDAQQREARRKQQGPQDPLVESAHGLILPWDVARGFC